MGFTRFALQSTARAAVAFFALTAAAASTAHAQVAAPGSRAMSTETVKPLTAYTGPKYDNRWEVYGGLQFSNGQAGQNLPRKYSMGGGEVMGTYWLGSAPVKKFGVIADYRFGAGTSQTGLIGAKYGLNRILVMQNIVSGGMQWRGPRNRYAAIDLHALVGGAFGDFNYALTHYPGYPASIPVTDCPAHISANQPVSLGMYCNSSTPWGAIGGSIDFNQSQKVAIRLSPDMNFEHYGTETREFFSISAGILYRFGDTGTPKHKVIKNK
ncbi:hypothetical protein ACFQBQ_13655 [Granulicella cerasi]|uniref:Outer membrane protein beta-barrel domain-containing protein n=1 Tax=Granulicella cerasi TaxID=741063 RepID=A0ABW1ZBR8_9BACT|nr:hypothetical protein [Granulicella cerasi]